MKRTGSTPRWMVSFSDMMTNILCFFILMVSLANEQSAGLKDDGIGSYLQKLDAWGLPGLMPAKRTLIPRDHPLLRYQRPQIDPLEPDQWIEHTRQMLDEQFERLSHSQHTAEPAVPGQPIPLQVGFSPRSSRLTFADRDTLDLLADALHHRRGMLEITGACRAEEATSWTTGLRLSLQRARSVARYLEKAGIPANRLLPRGVGAAPSTVSEGERGAAHVTLRWVAEQTN